MFCWTGVKTLLKPEKHQKPHLKQLTPQRLDFMVENKLKVCCCCVAGLFYCHVTGLDAVLVLAL
jgi:hypothetical protein